MSQTFFKLIFCIVLAFASASAGAQVKDSLIAKKDSIVPKKITQKKDSIKPKPVVIKEDVGVARKKKYTYIVSDRLSEDDKFDIFKTTPTSQTPGIIIVRGHLEVIGNPNVKKGRINVYNASNSELVGTFNTNGFTGNYILILVPNVKYIFKVEVSGYGITEEVVEVPLKVDYDICQQDMRIKLNEKKKAVLFINSFFADENEKVFYLKSTGDSVKANAQSHMAVHDEANNKTEEKNSKTFSTIDQMVKKQVEEEKKKPADALAAFKSNDFEKALLIYSALLKNDAADPFTNYYYGVCLAKLNRSRPKAINSLRLASNYKEVPYDVFYYLGRTCHLSYFFQDAIIALEEYKKRAKPPEIQNNNVLQLINNCKNGSELLSDQVYIELIKRSPANEVNLLTAYDPELIEDRLSYKTDFFKSNIDRQKQSNFLICHSDKREYIHVSYGPKEQSGTDLYRNIYGNPSMGASRTLGPDINTAYDENYPYLSKDGKTLYFSSKGHNSLGGYDIFKCTRTDSLEAWSKPQNLGYPINSTFDDVLFIPDTSGQFASYCSNRRNNKMEHILIKLPHGAVSNSIVKGSFSTGDSIPKHEAFISVYNSNTGELAGVYKTNPATGQYLMILQSGTKYEMAVEAEGFLDLNSVFEIPEKKGEFTLKQEVKFLKDGGKRYLKVNNYFTEDAAAKVSFEKVEEKQKTADNEKVKTDETKKEIKSKKLTRTPEEHRKDQEDLKLAKSFFDQAVYKEASNIYRDLSHHINLDPIDDYYYGISLYHTKKEKPACIAALASASNAKNVPMDVFYYLARANHVAYRFTAAINFYKKFMSVCKPAEVQKLNIEKEIEYCNNAIKFVNNPVVIEVYEKKHVDLIAIQNSLTQIESGSKVLVITDDMRSTLDKKKNFKSLLFLSADKGTVLYSSYGEDETKGKDIYMLKKLGNGKWAPVPQNISGVNSAFDEEYPSLSKDGKTIYFSSKGFENMGGYDIFKSTLDENTGVWSAPVNLGSPINSPFDDLYFLE